MNVSQVEQLPQDPQQTGPIFAQAQLTLEVLTNLVVCVVCILFDNRKSLRFSLNKPF